MQHKKLAGIDLGSSILKDFELKLSLNDLDKQHDLDLQQLKEAHAYLGEQIKAKEA